MSDLVARLNRALEGRYRIERELGAGGMATVYVADDLKHERKVALKVLRPELAAVVGAERFLAEIKTTANLQHPHILPLFDSGEADSFLFYVMPYVEGETLRDRLDREHQLPVADGVRIVRDLAEALEYAHARGVIHRDIKPANILIQAGRPLIADFGIALAVGAAGGGRLTETGLSVGTPHYMSPEQATGDVAVGPASDIYALGCVLYEMLVGEPPHTGSNAQAILGKIITGRVTAPTEHRASVPGNVDAAIRRALERVPADRFARASEFAAALGDPGFRHGEERAVAGTASRGLWNPLSVSAVALSAVLLALVGWSWLRPGPSDPVRMLDVTLDGPSIGPFTLSPDGTFILYSGGPGLAEGRMRRWATLESERLLARCCNRPQVSPDGEAFIDFDGLAGQTYVASIAAGTRTALGSTRFATWGRDGSVYVLRDDGLYRRPSPDGEPVRLADVTLDGDLRHPDVLPGGKGILVTRSVEDSSAIHLISTRDGSSIRLFDGVSPRYVLSGHLVFARLDGTLMAVGFDPDALELRGSPVATGHSISLRRAGRGEAEMSIADDGTLFYQQPGTFGARLIRLGRDGSERIIADDLEADFGSVALSPDGTRLATTVEEALAPRRLVVKSLPDGPMTDIAPGMDLPAWVYPAWDATGRWVYFNAQPGLWRVRADGSRPPERVLALDRPIAEALIAPDGTIVLRTFPSPGFDRDLLVLAPGDSVAQEFFSSAEDQIGPALSPDGRWLAYGSGPGTASQVFVRPFPGGDAQYPVSSDGGGRPEWSHSGRELFFVDDEGDLMVVEVAGDEFPTFSPPRMVSARTRDAANRFDVFPDDQSFLIVEPTGGGSRYVMVLNFTEELKRLVPR